MPGTIYAIMMGYLMDDLWIAFVISNISKITGMSIQFFIIKYFFRDHFNNMFEGYLTFKIMNKIVKISQLRVTLFMNFLIGIPTIVRTAVLAILDIHFWIFFIVTSLIGGIRTYVFVMKGKYIRVIAHNESKSIKNFEIAIIIIFYTGAIYLIYYFNNLFKQFEIEELEAKEKEKEEKDQEENKPLIPNLEEPI